MMGGTPRRSTRPSRRVAWFSVIPAFAWIYVQVETTFYKRFRSFYAELESGAPLRELKQGAGADLRRGEADPARRGRRADRLHGARHRRGAARGSRRRPVADATPLFRLAAVGAAMQVSCLLEVLLLYYFDLRRDALLISAACWSASPR